MAKESEGKRIIKDQMKHWLNYWERPPAGPTPEKVVLEIKDGVITMTDESGGLLLVIREYIFEGIPFFHWSRIMQEIRSGDVLWEAE
jgi:hypothetical protein